MTDMDRRRYGPQLDEETARALRLQAEAQLQTDGARQLEDQLAQSSPAETQQTLHELRVHQIELEMQNEELRQTQLELDAARARWFDLYDMAPVGYCTVSELGLIVHANITLTAMCGVARSALIQRLFSHFVIADDQDAYYLTRKQIVADGAPQSCELRMTRVNEPSWWAHLTMTANEDEHGTVELRIAVSDISARKAAEAELVAFKAQLQQAQKLESIGRLAGGVAHDFNNMLSVILGHCELALANEATPAGLRGDLGTIQQAARRSADFTRQLLAYAREQTVMPRVIDLGLAVPRSLRMLQRLIGENISLTWQPGDHLWPVLIDPAQVDQILANICVNARDAIKGAGTLLVATANCALDAAQAATIEEAVPGDYVLLTVTDSGCGMTDAVRARIFEPFFTTKDVGEGTGLGLASVYGAVRQNHGFVAVSSAPGFGATFKLYLPRYTGEREAHRMPGMAEAEPAPKGHETILVVEDEPAVCRMVVMSLGAQGYAMLDANGPRKAIEVVKERGASIALVLTDVLMPEMTGNELAARLGAIEPSLRFLFMSGYPANAGEGGSPVQKGADFIGKPFTLSALRTKVREVLDREAVVGSS